jgi:hypothetical protein
MEIMYDELTLTNDVSIIVSDGTYFGILDLLIQWHKEDPVDEFELQRNEFIYSGIAYDPNGNPIDPQGNRNPFIDRPEYVHLIWEDKTVDDLVKKEEVTEIKFEVKIVRIYYVKLSRREEFFLDILGRFPTTVEKFKSLYYRTICNHIASMTDLYCIKSFNSYYEKHLGNAIFIN